MTATTKPLRMFVTAAMVTMLLACGGGMDVEGSVFTTSASAETSIYRLPAVFTGDAQGSVSHGSLGVVSDSSSSEVPPASTDPQMGTSGNGSAAAGGGQVGINLPQVSYWDNSFMYADLARHSNITKSLRASDGTPVGDFNLFFDSNTQAIGTYKLVFSGQADLRLDAGGNSSVQNRHYDAATNITTADLVLPQEVKRSKWVAFTNTRRTPFSTVADGVTNVHLWRPGYPTDGSVTFTREFIDAMQKASVLRAMDTTSTNDNEETFWADRILPSYLGMPAKPVQAWEMLAKLANDTNRDLWINVPVKANDEYITKLAQLFLYGSDGVNPYTSTQIKPVYPPLKSNLRLYVEYGNEIWNFSRDFYNFYWVRDMASAVANDSSHPINVEGTDRSYGRIGYAAWRSSVISRTFRSVWGDGAMMTRVRPILATQIGDANNTLSASLRWAQAYYGADAIPGIWYGGGGAPYYGQTLASGATDAAAMATYFDAPVDAMWINRVQTDATWLKAYGLKYVAYEGGPEPGTGQGADVANAYNADSRMPAFMGKYWDAWVANGGDFFTFYNYTSMGAPWRFVDETRNPTVSDTTSPKMQFLASLPMRAPVAVSLGQQVPSTVYLRDPTLKLATYVEGSSDWGYQGTAWYINDVRNKVKNEFIAFPIRAQKAGSYSFSITTYDAKVGDRVELYVNGKLLGELIPNLSNPKGAAVESSAITVTLPEGLSGVRLRAKTGNNWVKELMVR